MTKISPMLANANININTHVHIIFFFNALNLDSILSVSKIVYMGMPGTEDSAQSMDIPQVGFHHCWACG